MIPHLTTALSGELLDLELSLLKQNTKIEQWFRSHSDKTCLPFYSSVDLRNAGFKLAPVDTNLFPGGFNNLNQDFFPLCIQATMSAIERYCPSACQVLLIPENHTRNLFYLKNVATIKRLLERSGIEVRIGSIIPDLKEPWSIEFGTKSVLLEPVQIIDDGRIGLRDFKPCVILLNNDLSSGVPNILQVANDAGQTIIPPLSAGWHQRKKSNHFLAYQKVVQAFSDDIGLDPWLLSTDFEVCGQIDFQKKLGQDCVERNVQALLQRIESRYREHGIKSRPFVIVKANSGTYGMGIMTVYSPEEVRSLNRRQKNKMSVGKEGVVIHDVLIQEGVPTIEQIDSGIAEPVIYMIDRYVVGGFYRIHTGRSTSENLNAPGMTFKPLSFETGCLNPNEKLGTNDPPNRFYAYGVVARLAALAASLEINHQPPYEGLL